MSSSSSSSAPCLSRCISSSAAAIPPERVDTNCEIIYNNLIKNVDHPFFQDESNKQTVMAQLRQQVEYINSRRQGKRRVG